MCLFVAGCDDCKYCIVDRSFSYQIFYSLINNTSGPLHYKAYYEKYYKDGDVFVFSFDTTLLPNDTLLLYFFYDSPIIPYSEDYTGFCAMLSYSYGYYDTGELTIRDNTEYPVFYISEILDCGDVDFIEEKKSEREYHYYWTIDSTYYAEGKACGGEDDDYFLEEL
jgi:hypothetical protein